MEQLFGLIISGLISALCFFYVLKTSPEPEAQPIQFEEVFGVDSLNIRK